MKDYKAHCYGCRKFKADVRERYFMQHSVKVCEACFKKLRKEKPKNGLPSLRNAHD